MIRLNNRNMLTVDQGRFALPFFQTSSSTDLADTCRPKVDCPSPLSHFRTIDGSCNNEQRPEWGQINVALQRIIPPKYGDGAFIFISSSLSKNKTFHSFKRCQHSEIGRRRHRTAQLSISISIIDRIQSPIQSK